MKDSDDIRSEVKCASKRRIYITVEIIEFAG